MNRSRLHIAPVQANLRLRRPLALLLLAALLAGSLLPLAPAYPAYAQDAPAAPVAPAANGDVQIFAQDNHSAFYVANGMAYWSWYCGLYQITAAGVDGGDPAAAAAAPDAPASPQAPPDPAFLKRKPLSGGTTTTVAFTDFTRSACTTYYMPTVDGDGVYYYVKTGTNTSSNPKQIEFRPGGGGGNPKVVMVVNDTTAPDFNDSRFERFATDADYVYWATVSGTVLRARKNGSSSSPELVADGFPPGSLNDVLVVGSTLFIGAESGIWRIGTNACPQPSGPCAETMLSNIGGTGMTYRVSSGSGPIKLTFEQIYYVSGEAIFRWSCSTIVVINCPQTSTAVHSHDPGDGLNWSIGRPAFSGNLMFWLEGHNLDNLSGTLRRKDVSVANPNATPGDPIADTIYSSSHPVFVEGNNVYFSDFQSPDYFIKRISTLSAPITRDLTASAVEVTQGIQNLANSAPLAAKKLTYVRAYGTNALGPRANTVQARLYGTRNGNPLPGTFLLPTNGTRALVQGVSPDRARLNDGWLFQLPSSWVSTSGAISLRLVVDPSALYTDPNRTNNELTVGVSFQNQPPACAIYVPVRTNNPKTNTNMPNFWDMVGRYKRLVPMPSMLNYTTSWQAEEVEVCWWGPFPHPCGGPFELDQGASISDWIPDKDEAIAQLWLFDVVNDAPACDDAGAYTHIMGMVHPQAPTGNTGGYASTISSQSWVKLPPASPNPFPNTWNAMYEASTMAQELTHNYGRGHVDCGNPGGVDSGWPANYPKCQIAPTGQSSYYGFDSKTLTPIAPTAARDYMAYGSPRWVSDYTWRGVMNAVAASSKASAASPNLGLIVSADGTVLASGHVDTAKKLGQLNYVRVFPNGALSAAMAEKMVQVATSEWQEAAAAHSDDPLATIHLQLIGASGVLTDTAVTLLPIDDHDATTEAQIFVASFPAPAGKVLTVRLLDGTTILDERNPGPNAPVVTLSQPAGGTTVQESMTVAWQASDPDVDPLLFTLQYSYDGGTTWQALASDVVSTPDPNYQIVLNDLSSLHGSAPSAARVRVIASDGYNTTIATSQPFTLVDRNPVAFITDPTTGQTHDPQLPVDLHGGATDAEEGALEGGSLLWKIGATAVATDTDASIGGLAPGVYTATLEARDSGNRLGTATAPLLLAALSIPLGGSPTHDGLCDDAAYDSGAQILLKPYGDGSQASLRLVRDANYLWACFSGLKSGAVAPGAFVGLRVDVDNSKSAQAQADDYGFFVGEDGGHFTRAGNGAGGFDEPGPDGVLQAQITANDAGTYWNAELRISRTTLGGWDHLVGMKAGHYQVTALGDDYGWPYAAPSVALSNAPSTWGRTALGLVPAIDAVTPFSATVGGPEFVVTVEGQHFAPGAVILINGAPVSTTSALAAGVDASVVAADAIAAGMDADTAAEQAAALAETSTLTATVPAAALVSPGLLSISVRNPGPLDAAAVTLAVNTPLPAIASLSPAQRTAESGGFTLTVNGSNFVNGATVFWDGQALATTFDSSGVVRAQVPPALLAQGRLVGITVRNPSPSEGDSNSAEFTVAPNFTNRVLLPVISK